MSSETQNGTYDPSTENARLQDAYAKYLTQSNRLERFHGLTFEHSYHTRPETLLGDSTLFLPPFIAPATTLNGQGNIARMYHRCVAVGDKRFGDDVEGTPCFTPKAPCDTC